MKQIFIIKRSTVICQYKDEKHIVMFSILSNLSNTLWLPNIDDTRSMIPVCSPGIMVKKNNYLVPGFKFTVCNEHNFFK